MWSDATWWSSYTSSTGFLQSTDREWIGAAVNTMDTGSAFLPYRSVKSVAENAELAWTFIRSRMEALGAHEVDLVGHSLGGVIIRRMLHDPANGAAARSAVRSVVLLGTPNGGSDCSSAWPVPANSEITFAAMDTFNLAYPGYPGAFTTSLYADHIGSTCFGASSGDLFVPAWSTQAQSVDVVQRITPGVQHAFLPSDAGVFANFVRPELALAAAPVSTGPTTALANPGASTTRLADGTATGASLSITQTVTVSPGDTLVASVVAPHGSTGLLTYPSGSGTASVAMSAVGDYPIIEGRRNYAELGGTSGPLTVTVTIDAATPQTASSELRWSLVARR
jgi:pimeloyl-ACP methyl ester carboxylesterase